MALTVDEKSLKHGVLTLVVTLVEVIQEALERQALRRMEGGDLTPEETERLGEALLELDEAMKEIKDEHGITVSVADLHRGLDEVVDDVVDKLVNPARWAEEAGPGDGTGTGNGTGTGTGGAR
ncbi:MULTISPECIES: gas vesicle protein K [Streptomyces]|uniref:Gas vesicle protein K n=2 Tax=Streptomyces TaxID=1883 RepID=A0A3R7FDT8_9ACTN|nr:MULTISPECIES: gas vesicle protein K [Streptomyces]KNE84315.1 gas vesicle K [Streptomyces fradiae]OFA58897.1 gas vesicle K [Streptomyces fradiae]PQM22175.1 gas vesicle protein K [Streptomyces xinghaiensis]RKM95427.1 gas vesicle protein K [Streptomyces xinghaiensis]RNC73011.1 gas vesicle protein K [Streptomyces xinghaiensis]